MKNNNMFKRLSLIIVLFACVCLVGCGNKPVDENNVTPTQATDANTSTTPTVGAPTGAESRENIRLRKENAHFPHRIGPV